MERAKLGDLLVIDESNMLLSFMIDIVDSKTKSIL